MEAKESPIDGKKYLTEDEMAILKSYSKSVNSYYEDGHQHIWYPMFYKQRVTKQDSWLSKNEEQFFKGTRNKILYNRWYFSELGEVMAMEFAPNGAYIVVGHSSGAIQV